MMMCSSKLNRSALDLWMHKVELWKSYMVKLGIENLKKLHIVISLLFLKIILFVTIHHPIHYRKLCLIVG